MSDFEWWLVRCGVDEKELSDTYKQLDKIATALHNMKTGNSGERIKIIQECWSLQRKIGELLDDTDRQLQTAIDTHQKRRMCAREGSGVLSDAK